MSMAYVKICSKIGIKEDRPGDLIRDFPDSRNLDGFNTVLR